MLRFFFEKNSRILEIRTNCEVRQCFLTIAIIFFGFLWSFNHSHLSTIMPAYARSIETLLSTKTIKNWLLSIFLNQCDGPLAIQTAFYIKNNYCTNHPCQVLITNQPLFPSFWKLNVQSYIRASINLFYAPTKLVIYHFF